MGKATTYLKRKVEGKEVDPIIDRIVDDLSKNGEFEPGNDKDSRERVLASIVRRRGQPEFRKKLIAIYNGECAITGYNEGDALEAAHIQPYNGSHSNHPSNGLLLRADIHTLFDLNLITVDTSDMSILLAPQLRETSYKFLTGKPLRTPKNTEDLPNKDALDEHRDTAGF